MLRPGMGTVNDAKLPLWWIMHFTYHYGDKKERQKCRLNRWTTINVLLTKQRVLQFQAQQMIGRH